MPRQVTPSSAEHETSHQDTTDAKNDSGTLAISYIVAVLVVQYAININHYI